MYKYASSQNTYINTVNNIYTGDSRNDHTAFRVFYHHNKRKMIKKLQNKQKYRLHKYNYLHIPCIHCKEFVIYATDWVTY